MKRCTDLFAIVLRVLAYLLFGPQYSGNHDYRSLRLRYSHHVWAYGWTRSWRCGSWVLSAANDGLRNSTPWVPRIAIRRASEMKAPYWRDPHYVRLFKSIKWSVVLFRWQETQDGAPSGVGNDLFGGRILHPGGSAQLTRTKGE